MSPFKKVQFRCRLFALLFLVSSCIRPTSDSSIEKSNRQEDALGIDGKYKVVFSPLNASVAGMSEGLASLHVIGDTFSVNIDMKQVHASTLHMQAIYNGSACPTFANDTNDDGFIDQIEALRVTGKVLIPLDGKLDSQDEGGSEFPMATAAGQYKYDRDSSLGRLTDDLRMIDINEEDTTIKLGSNELSFVGKVIVIHGVAEEIYLPGSVRSFGLISERATLPVACGIILRESNYDTTVEPEEAEALH